MKINYSMYIQNYNLKRSTRRKTKAVKNAKLKIKILNQKYYEIKITLLKRIQNSK